MAGSLDGKVALVTGGSSGFGRATSLAFAREGAKVVIGNRGVAGGEETVRMIQSLGGDAKFVKTDVSIGKEVEALVAQTVEIYGALHCAFNNAGILGALAPTADCTEENWGVC
jgi:NAD(P)-dependent dehydrogenase (short-subunit alcohol dehydrogenase family)